MSQQYKTTPSSLLGIDDDYIAWCLNEAVYIFSNHVESKMHEAEARAKGEKQKSAARQRILQMMLKDDTPGEEGPRPGTFRDPASGFSGKRKA